MHRPRSRSSIYCYLNQLWPMNYRLNKHSTYSLVKQTIDIDTRYDALDSPYFDTFYNTLYNEIIRYQRRLHWINIKYLINIINYVSFAFVQFGKLFFLKNNNIRNSPNTDQLGNSAIKHRVCHKSKMSLNISSEIVKLGHETLANLREWYEF